MNDDHCAETRSMALATAANACVSAFGDRSMWRDVVPMLVEKSCVLMPVTYRGPARS